jgi:Helix-turn-helix domain
MLKNAQVRRRAAPICRLRCTAVVGNRNLTAMSAGDPQRSGPNEEVAMAPLAFTIPAASAASATSRTSLYEEIRRGRLQARKRGRRTVILRDDLEAWLSGLPVVPRLEREAAA